MCNRRNIWSESRDGCIIIFRYRYAIVYAEDTCPSTFRRVVNNVCDGIFDRGPGQDFQVTVVNRYVKDFRVACRGVAMNSAAWRTLIKSVSSTTTVHVTDEGFKTWVVFDDASKNVKKWKKLKFSAIRYSNIYYFLKTKTLNVSNKRIGMIQSTVMPK